MCYTLSDFKKSWMEINHRNCSMTSSAKQLAKGYDAYLRVIWNSSTGFLCDRNSDKCQSVKWLTKELFPHSWRLPFLLLRSSERKLPVPCFIYNRKDFLKLPGMLAASTGCGIQQCIDQRLGRCCSAQGSVWTMQTTHDTVLLSLGEQFHRCGPSPGCVEL